MGRGDGEGLKGRGRGEIGGGEEGVKEGISQTDMMKCLGGRRLQSFLTLFTRATPGTSASIHYNEYAFHDLNVQTKSPNNTLDNYIKLVSYIETQTQFLPFNSKIVLIIACIG